MGSQGDKRIMTQAEPLTPLPDQQLSPMAQRFAGAATPANLRQAAARGKAMLPPPDVLIAIYQAAAYSEAAADLETAKLARDTTATLDEKLVRAGLQGHNMPAVVLDFLARAQHGLRWAVELFLRHRNTADRTIEFLASVCGTEDLELIAQDEQRLLQAPGVIAALYMNPKARASTALRAVELAARNGVVVDIPGFEDVVAALSNVKLTAADDAKFQAAVESGKAVVTSEPELDPDKVTQEDVEHIQATEEAKTAAPAPQEEEVKTRFEDLPVPHQIRLATLGTAFDRSIAIRSTIRTVAMAAIRSPAVRPNEAMKYAGNRALHEDVIRYIANKKDWCQLAAIRLALINNNKTPLGVALRFLPFLHQRDLKGVSKSRNIPGPIVKGAKELMAKREKR